MAPRITPNSRGIDEIIRYSKGPRQDYGLLMRHDGVTTTQTNELRQMLNQLYPGLNLEPQGPFDAQVEEVVRHFQAEHGLNDDGKVGQLTARALREALEANPAGEAASPPPEPVDAMEAAPPPPAPAGSQPELNPPRQLVPVSGQPTMNARELEAQLAGERKAAGSEAERQALAPEQAGTAARAPQPARAAREEQLRRMMDAEIQRASGESPVQAQWAPGKVPVRPVEELRTGIPTSEDEPLIVANVFRRAAAGASLNEEQTKNVVDWVMGEKHLRDIDPDVLFKLGAVFAREAVLAEASRPDEASREWQQWYGYRNAGGGPLELRDYLNRWAWRMRDLSERLSLTSRIGQ